MQQSMIGYTQNEKWSILAESWSCTCTFRISIRCERTVFNFKVLSRYSETFINFRTNISSNSDSWNAVHHSAISILKILAVQRHQPFADTSSRSELSRIFALNFYIVLLHIVFKYECCCLYLHIASFASPMIRILDFEWFRKSSIY